MKTKNEKHWLKIYSTLSENQKRWFAAQRAIELGRGGVSSVSVLTEMSRTTITKGMAELQSAKKLKKDAVRACSTSDNA